MELLPVAIIACRWHSVFMHASIDPSQLNASQLRQLVAQMQQQIGDQDARLAEQAAIIARRDEAIRRYQIREEQMSHEMALLKRSQEDRDR